MISVVVIGLCTLLLTALIVWSCLTGGSIQGGTNVSVNGTASAQGTGTITLSPLQTTLTSSAQESLTYGTASGQCNLIVCQDRTLAASASETLDLYGHTTPLLDIFGAACLFLHVKYLAIYVLPGTGDVNGLVVGNAASNPWVGPLGGTSPTVTIYPSGPGFQIGEPTVGWAVSASHGQLLITNASGAVATSYRIVIGGTTT